MALAITAYEFYGPATGDPLNPSTFKAPISDMSMKSVIDPTKLYYDYPISRPMFGLQSYESFDASFVGKSMKRYISFRITGSYNKIKNVKIRITKPELYRKIGGEYSAVTDDTTLSYKLTNTYEDQQTSINYYSQPCGVFDGTMNVITDDTVLRPKISSSSPAYATNRQVEYVYADSYWTEFLVLQLNVYPSDVTNVGSFGKQGGVAEGGITGPLVTVEVDEVGDTLVD